MCASRHGCVLVFQSHFLFSLFFSSIHDLTNEHLKDVKDLFDIGIVRYRIGSVVVVVVLLC